MPLNLNLQNIIIFLIPIALITGPAIPTIRPSLRSVVVIIFPDFFLLLNYYFLSLIQRDPAFRYLSHYQNQEPPLHLRFP